MNINKSKAKSRKDIYFKEIALEMILDEYGSLEKYQDYYKKYSKLRAGLANNYNLNKNIKQG